VHSGADEPEPRAIQRLLAEFVGTCFLVLAAVGTPTSASLTGDVSPAATVVAPALTVMAMVLALGGISGAHLNPMATLAFCIRRDFPARRVPSYLLAQGSGAIAACVLLRAILGASPHVGRTSPEAGMTALGAISLEAVLTAGLITVIVGTATRGRNVGALSAVAVGGYIALAGLWAGPLTGASMNPARSLGPDVVSSDYSELWIYLTGPFIGMVAAVAIARVLHGPGGAGASRRAAQGDGS
jgi:aquaporin Z